MLEEHIKIESNHGDITAYLAKPESRAPGIILIHEVWGLTEHMMDVAGRLAKEGYCVVAPDLLSQTGIHKLVDQNIMKEVMNPATRDEAQKKLRAAMAPLQAPEFGGQTVDKLKTCFEYLKNMNFCTGNVAVMGFCFGGTYSYSLALAEPELAAAVVFYGHAPQPIDKIEAINCPVLVFNGEKDENLMKQLPEVKAAAEKFGKNFKFHEYPNAGHAFFNDSNAVLYRQDAAEDAWQITLKFLKKHVS